MRGGAVWLRQTGWPVQYRELHGGTCMENDDSMKSREPTLWDVLVSVLASMFGVQSSRNREKDFTHGRPSQYIIIGLLMTIIFVLTVWGVVKLVMKLAGV